MSEIFIPTANRGYILELDRMPNGLAPRLDASEAVQLASRTVEGLYVEPATSLGHMVLALEELGYEIQGLRAVSQVRGWEAQPSGRRNRLRNPLSACWVPGLNGR